MSGPRTLRQLLQAEGPIQAPSAWDPLIGRVLEDEGFPCVMVGGWVTGASTAITEPLLTMTEQVDVAGAVARAVTVPIIADGHTGYGDPIHVRRAVREYERASIAAIHIEDQLFPKRAHYHACQPRFARRRDVTKIRHALAARDDPDFVTIARTDAFDAVDGSLEETIRRCRTYRDAGADVLMPLPSPSGHPHGYSLELGRAVSEGVPDIPLIWLAGSSGSEREPTADEIHSAGFKIIMYPIMPILAAVGGVVQMARTLKREGKASVAEAQEGQGRDPAAHRPQRDVRG
ncbi:isocitrate lyase/PEP mutase family protein [Acuticoccus sp.]|uniref:isocitrate lyase/PEP mutase family protein n=1 Tax=Acuticoccus sp. TaxID=1904378 RepID=UPI003B51CEBE